MSRKPSSSATMPTASSLARGSSFAAKSANSSAAAATAVVSDKPFYVSKPSGGAHPTSNSSSLAGGPYAPTSSTTTATTQPPSRAPPPARKPGGDSDDDDDSDDEISKLVSSIDAPGSKANLLAGVQGKSPTEGPKKAPSSSDVLGGEEEANPNLVYKNTLFSRHPLYLKQLGGVPVFSASCSPEKDYMVVGLSNGDVWVYNVRTENPDFHFNTTINGTPITCVRFRPAAADRTNVVAICGADGTLQHWHVTTPKCLHKTTETDNGLLCCEYRRDGLRLAVGAVNCAVRVYDDSRHEVVEEWKPNDSSSRYGSTNSHTGRVCALKWHNTEPDILLSGGWDRTVKIWDIRMGDTVGTIFGPYLCGQGLDVHGNEILTGSTTTKKAVQVWDRRTYKLLYDLITPISESEVWCCQFLLSPYLPSQHCRVAAGGTRGLACVLEYGNHPNDVTTTVVGKLSPNATAYTCTEYPVLGEPSAHEAMDTTGPGLRGRSLGGGGGGRGGSTAGGGAVGSCGVVFGFSDGLLGGLVSTV